MKKLVLTLSLCSTFVLAANGVYTQEDRIQDMQKMANAMGSIQNGFFYNNLDLIKEGGIILADTIEHIEPPLEEKEEKDLMNRFLNNKVKMTDSIKRRIKKKAGHMIEAFADGNPKSALQDFTKITEKCMECHTRLRKW